ncbi:hypothetical protein L7F22_052499 [Adiantum nelumboides]|nr:hypothetical protein [Adiantum nelumboides]
MGTPAPALSCSTDALSNALTVDSDDEVDQSSSMWVQEEDHTFSDLPPDFLEPLSPGSELFPSLPPIPTLSTGSEQQKGTHENRQFWKSGDFTAASFDGASFATEGMDHVRVHPKFLHSNATSHKWVLGAIAELLDNAVDEIRNGATFVKIDVQSNPRNGEAMLVIEDDGGGMDPDCIRHCMSLGYSAKSKISNTIGQYGNGFKTSTMRLGADVIVFSRNQGSKPSESIGMMSYTFLTSTGQNDVVVPIVDFQVEAFGIRKLIRSSVDDWMESMQTIQDWSPYSSQAELMSQFRSMPHRQGTKVIIYNLWEDEEGCLELDFTADPHDIQIRATSRDVKTLKLAARFPSCKHYLTHRHSLRTYISILYLRLPAKFKIFLRGIEVSHHTLRNEMMLVEQVTYRPKDAGHSKAVVTLGFVKDAKEHIDVSGFNVYHKNRLIKPFWRIWNPSDTRGRGIIAILEANFVEPAHDKQGFERTIVLTRLEARLIEMQKSYWNKHCHMIGYTNASLKKAVRPLPKDISKGTNSAANGGAIDVPANVVAIQADAQQLIIEKAVASVHDDSVASDHSCGQEGFLSVMMQPMQEASFNFSRTEMEEPNFVPFGMDSKVNIVNNSSGTFFHKQDPLQVEPSFIHTLQSVQDAPLTSVQRVVSGRSVQNALCSPTALNSQSPRSCFAPVVIDLDSPDIDQHDDGACEMPDLHSCGLETKIIPEEMHLASDLLSGADHGCKNSLQGDDAAGSLKGNEAERVSEASFIVSTLREVNTLPETVGSKGCNDEDSRGIKQVEAGPVEHDNESYVDSHDLVATVTEGCFAGSTSIVRNGEQVEVGTLRETVPENGGCSEAHGPTTIELDDFFDSLEAPLQTPPLIKDSEAFVRSPVSKIDLILPDIEDTVTLKNDQVPLFISIKAQGENEATASVDSIKEQAKQNIATCQALMLPAMEAKVDMDVVMRDVHRQEDDNHLGPKQDVAKDLQENVAAIVEQQTHDNVVIVPHDVCNFHDKQASASAVVEQIPEGMAIVSHETGFDDQRGSHDRLGFPCLDIVNVPTFVMVDDGTDGIVENICGGMLEGDRSVATKQQIDYLQHSIEVVVVEVDDLKEQLQQQREFQHLELRSLNMELERALSRLEELRG